MKFIKSLVFSTVITSLVLMIMTQKVKADTILMFVAHEQTYYSEYIIMKEALEASGYTVDVRSSSSLDFTIYMSPYSDISNAANGLSGSSYAEFQSQFLGMFGADWPSELNAIPAMASTNGSLVDVSSIANYAGLVVVGGTGSLHYRVDGNYANHGDGEREVSAEIVQQTSEYLNELAIEALRQGKPVMAQCHGASIPAFWRIPGTSGPGEEALGYSLLKGEISAGYPEPTTMETLESLNVIYRPEDRVTIASPHSSLNDDGAGTGRIITTRDWFPQTVTHAARTFINILESYPSNSRKATGVETLVIHGGALDPMNCSPGNKGNDIPCNHGGGSDLPADYTHLMALLQANESQDDLNINASDLDVSLTLPFDATSEAEALTYFEDYEVIIFFKHWSNHITDEMLQAIVTFADNGGGVIGLHHGLYNDQNGIQNKDILVTELFGAESSNTGWAANLTTFDMYATDHGHFISSYLTSFDEASTYPVISSWSNDPLPAVANSSFSTLPHFEVYDELYVNFDYSGDIPIGRGVNFLTPLFSHDGLPPGGSASQTRQAGFTQQFDGNEDGTIGKVAYVALGERRENMEATSTYGQIIRNMVIWAAPSIADKLTQSLSLEQIEDKQITDEPFAISATASSGLSLKYMLISGPATLSGNVVSLTGNSGLIAIEITQEGNDLYETISETIVIKVLDPAKQSQEITFGELEDRSIGDSPFDLVATASSGLPVTFSVVAGSALLSGQKLTLTGTGTVKIEASQAGNEEYNPANSVLRSFVVSSTPETILDVEESADGVLIFPNPANKWLNVYYESAQASLSIYSVSGEKIWEQTHRTETSLDVSLWKAGIYLLKMLENKKIITTKIVISR